ncbi:MAG: hypothetical protein ABIT38_04820, partial [Gemmatimonadaceae bacterium]
MTRIGVTYQGSSELPEAVSEALGVLGDVITIPTNDDLPARLHHEALDIVFGMAGRGDEIARRLQVAAFLDYYAIPYVGGDAVAQATCLQRARMKETLSYHGVATTAFTLIDSEEQLAPLARRAFPVTVLPARPLIVDGASQVAYD